MSKNKIDYIVLKKERISDFAKERNILLKKSKANWVFFVDSDEKISDKLKKEALKKINDTRFNGYFVDRRNYFLGDYVGTDKILRFARRTAGKWGRKVHETWKVEGKVGQLTNPIIHNTADDLTKYIAKINYYSSLHAEANYMEGKRSSFFKIIVYPKLKFLETLIKSRNFIFSLAQALHSFLAWTKLWELQKN